VLEMKQNSNIFQCVAVYLVFFPDWHAFHSRANRCRSSVVAGGRNDGVENVMCN